VLSTSAAEAVILRVSPDGRQPLQDSVVVEEPLEIRLEWGRVRGPGRGVSVTMRTPGDDLALAVGFLYSEGILRRLEDLEGVRHCGRPARDDGTSNVVKVQLRTGEGVDLTRLERNTYMSSSCGVCGKTSLEAVRTNMPAPLAAGPVLSASLIHSLPRRLRRHQGVFETTGGLHAAGLFDSDGRLIRVREDVGRHNAVDKVIGDELLAGTLPRSNAMLFVSGRASFELVQKALMAGIPVLGAVGAPSSLAVELAADSGMTLLGFVRDGRFNVYCGSSRLGEP
jgi:FdhD protein